MSLCFALITARFSSMKAAVFDFALHQNFRSVHLILFSASALTVLFR